MIEIVTGVLQKVIIYTSVTDCIGSLTRLTSVCLSHLGNIQESFFLPLYIAFSTDSGQIFFLSFK